MLCHNIQGCGNPHIRLCAGGRILAREPVGLGVPCTRTEPQSSGTPKPIHRSWVGLGIKYKILFEVTPLHWTFGPWGGAGNYTLSGPESEDVIPVLVREFS